MKTLLLFVFWSFFIYSQVGCTKSSRDESVDLNASLQRSSQLALDFAKKQRDVGNLHTAKETLEAFDKNFPNSTLLNDAKDLLKKVEVEFRKKDYGKEAKKLNQQMKKLNAENSAREMSDPGPKPSSTDYKVAITSYLESNAHDPDSLEYLSWDQPMQVNFGNGASWGVTVSYRGKNAFGAKVLNTNMFLIKRGMVLGVR
jgi:hypothetical protein